MAIWWSPVINNTLSRAGHDFDSKAMEGFTRSVELFEQMETALQSIVGPEAQERGFGLVSANTVYNNLSSSSTVLKVIIINICQFFFNSVDRKLRAGQQMPSNHTPANFLEKNYATPLALAATAVLTLFVLKRFFGGLYSKLVLAEPEKKIDEGLPNFYKTVKLQDADWLIGENTYYEENYGMKMVSKELTSRLDSNSLVTRPM